MIIELAQNASEYKDKLAKKGFELVKHLVLLFCYRNLSYVDHWQDELSSFVNHISKFKHNNKYPTSKELSNIIFPYTRESFESGSKKYFKQIEKDEVDLDKYRMYEADLGDMYYFISSFINWYCEEIMLTEDKYLKQKYVANKAAQLLIAYPYELTKY